LNSGSSVVLFIRITMSRTFHDLRNYLTANVNSSLQIDDHPSLPITLSKGSFATVSVATHGKAFNTLEHVFHHYNKYNAAKRLDTST